MNIKLLSDTVMNLISANISTHHFLLQFLKTSQVENKEGLVSALEKAVDANSKAFEIFQKIKNENE